MSGNHFPALCGIFVILTCVSSSFINFEPGFEYQYKYDSNANVKNLGDFQVLAKVGYINVGDSVDKQEIYVKVYALELKTKHSEDTIGHHLDFSKWFSFVITPQGEILHVYHPPDDDDEAVAMKKGAAAMFASRLHHATDGQVYATDDGWGYHVRETGHEGPHNATYSVRPTHTGHVFTKTRHPGHHPIEHATSDYTKTLYYDTALGTMHTIQVKEKFRVMHKTAEGYDPYENSRPVKAVNNFTEMELPEMSAQGTGKLVFLSKHKVVNTPSRPKTDINTASIHIKQVKRKKAAVSEKEYLKFEQYMKGNLTCMRNEPDKGSKKLNKCFTELVAVLRDLPDKQLTLLAKRYLTDRPRLTKTFKDQNHMFDAIAGLTTDLSQQLLLDLVLNRSRPDSSLVKRFMFHIVSLDEPPIDDIITKLKSLCFEREKAPEALQEHETYNRMVLALGAVARRLLDAGRKEEAVDIVTKLEGWLGVHDPWLFRTKRSTMTEIEVLDDDRWRVILLGSLGNAGLDQSFEMIVSHVNTTNSQWVKRAGIHALRKYQQEGAAHLMLKTALYDDDEKVRYEALLQYQAHPKAARIAPMYREEGPMNGSIFHVDPRYVGKRDIEVHHRSKRGFGNLQIKVASPIVDWKKMLGSTTIGASFGLIMNNALDFKIAPLGAHTKVNIQDEAYARIHLGFMKKNLEFFLARICFKGEASYNLNMLQEFGVEKLQELAKLYDAVKSEAAAALMKGLELFKSIIDGEFSLADMIEGFRTALEELPDKVISAGKKASDAMDGLGQLDEKQLPPFAKPATDLVLKITNLYNDVKSSVLSFYNQLMETVTIIIPRAGKMIYKSIKAIIDSFRTFNKDPKQAISTVADNIITIGREVNNLVDVLNKAKNAIYTTLDKTPDWMDLGSKVLEIVEAAAKAKTALLEVGEKWIKEVVKGRKDPVAEFSKGKSNVTAMRQKVVTMMADIVDDVLAPLEPLRNLGRKFVNTFQKVFDLIKTLKEAYNTLKEGYRTARSLIDRVFGPKCHKEFPRTLRLAGGGCDGNGSYPSELKNGDEYEHEGIDVTISPGKEIVAPVAGNIMLSDKSHEVIIIPNAGSLKETEVIITNINPNSSLSIQHPGDSTYVDNPVTAGQKIGVAANSPCVGNEHIHFSLKRKGSYVDPTHYLEDRVLKVPEWVQECDDFKVVFKDDTIAENCIICPNGKDKNDTSPERKGAEVDKPEDLDSSKDPSPVADAVKKKPNSMFQRMQSRKPQIKRKTKKTKDRALATLFGKTSAFLKKFSIRTLKIGSVFDTIEILDLDESKKIMEEIIKTIQEMISNKPCFNPYQMTNDQLRTELTEKGMRAEGTREQMINSLTTPSNTCPLMKISMPDNIYCTFDDKCLGLECCVHFNLFMFRTTYKMFARFDPCDLKFSVGAGKFNTSIGIESVLKDVYAGLEKTIPTNVKLDILGGIELLIRMKLEKDDTAVYITVGAGFCSQDDYDNCIAFFNILDEFPTPLPICHPDGSITWPDVDYRSLLDKESIKRRIRESAEKIAKDAVKKGIEELLDVIPCISPDAPGKADPCPRPEALTRDILKQKLLQRGLQITGTRDELEQRLTVGHRTCRLMNRTVTLPTIKNDKINKIVYMEIAPNCLRFDACVDIRIKKLNFNKAVNAYIQLDPCKFTMTVNFEDCTETVILLGYDWGKEKTTRLNEWVSIRYTIDRSEARKVFVVDMGLQISVGESEPILNDLLIENVDVPIPICNENFSLPGNGSLNSLAKQMGGKLIREVVDVVFRKLGLDKILLDGRCTALTPQPDCPSAPADYKNLLPASFHDNVNCELPDNCFGIECCVDFSFDIPLFENPLVKHVPFFLKFEPCNFIVEVGFGSYYHRERLLTYNWGTENQLHIGNGNPSPVVIKFKISKYPKGFLVDLSVHTCIPIDGDRFCYPEGGMTLMNQEKIPVCDANALVEFTKQNFSVSDWLRDLNLDVNLKSLSQAAARLLLDRFGISEILLDDRCDASRTPYKPSVNGWRNECPKSISKLPNLPSGLYCHLADTCTKINCCFHVPFLEMSFNAVLNVDMCDYVIYAAIENKTRTLGILGNGIDLNAGTSLTLDIADVFQMKFGLKKKDKVLLLDLDIEVCLEKDSCLVSAPIMKGTEVPQLVCNLDATLLKGVSLDFWKSENCTLQTSACPASPPATMSSTCRHTDNCKGITCCVDVDLKYLGIYSINAGFVVDHCNDQLMYHIENKEWTKKLQAVDYDKNHTESIGNAITVSYVISKTASSYEVSFHVKLCVMNVHDLINNCYYYELLDEMMFQIPSSCSPVGRRRKRRSPLDLMHTGNAKRILNHAMNQKFTNEEIKDLLERLEAEAKRDNSLMMTRTDKDGTATNTKSAIRKMGIANPGTILYSGEIGEENLVSGMEGGEKIMTVLGQVTDILGRGDQAYTVGKGLTWKGLKLLGAKVANMSTGQIIALFDAKNIDPELPLRLARQLRDLALALYSDIIYAITNDDGTNAFSSFDITLQGNFSIPRKSTSFFKRTKYFLVGGILPMTFEFGAGAFYGMDIVVGAKILGMTLFGEVKPYGGASVYGELSIGVVLYGKLRFDGYLMNIAFPSRAEIGFYKFPLDLSLKMDVELVPLELTLKGLVTLEIKLIANITIKKTLYKADIWQYATSEIKKRLIDTGKKEEDKSPPQFFKYLYNAVFSGRKKRPVSTSQSCLVRQLPNRDYTEPAVEIAIAAQDDRSQVQIFVDAGTKPGLSDVLRQSSLGGPSAIITQPFPQNSHGVPVYFTVYGENSAGARSTVTCSIPTYDVTPPGGRLTADFSSTSNPAELRGNVVVYEDSDLVKSSVGVGLGRGIYADEIIAYSSVNLKDRNNAHYDPSSDQYGDEALKHFTGLKKGRLIGPVFAEFFRMNHTRSCVKECMKLPASKCMSVNYDFGKSGHCELLEGIEGHDHKIVISDQYSHYERLGVGLAHEFIYKDLSLRRGIMYYFNLHLINNLQFDSILHSKGVVVDLTPPEPGPLANVSLDVLEVTSCESVVPDDRSDWEVKCRGVNSQTENHRIIHDGTGSKTVFNGDEPLTDLLYTRANKYVSANWDGITDNETGILGYSLTVGTQICEELIHPHHDPHKHLLDESEWTHTGLISPIPAPHNPLPDGKYYITLRALNKVDYGGPLVTTICHTTPLVVDNSPPLLFEVYNVSYDEDTFLINAQYNARDPDSDIREADLCLGRTIRDCLHMDWQRSSHNDGDITRQFQIPGGTPVWIKVRVINNVDLMTVGVSDYPIIVDISPPEPGIVYDGPFFRHDLNFTKDADKICANWFGFHDPESGISRYEVSVLDDTYTTISELVSLDHKTHDTCVQLGSDHRLEHGKAYRCFMTAFNAGHKQLNVSAMSDGVIVDLTAPVPGDVVDGIRESFVDVEFSAHVATVGTQWRNQSDPESDIREYAVQILRAKGLSSEFEVLRDWKTLSKDIRQIELHSFHLNHQDIVKTKLKTINNALGSVEQTTDGFVVDLIPPRMVFLGDGREQNKDTDFQTSTTTVEANFRFKDDESGMDHYKYQVYELYHGSKHQIYPDSEGWETSSDPSITSLSQSGLSLRPGAQYSVRVGAVNRAGAVATYDTNGVLVDNTPPQMEWVYVGIFSGSEEELIDGYVIQSDPSAIKATWFATDSESGIKSYMVAVGTTNGGTDILNWNDFGSDRDKYMDGLTLTVTDPDTMTPVYYVSVKASNGANFTSDVITSNPIRVVDQDKAGIVIDGADSTERTDFMGIGSDMDHQKDTGVVTVQFAGFESHEHGVTYYDWAIGTTPGGEEVQPFIMAGLIHEEAEANVSGNGIASMGFGQTVLPLSPGTTYYTTVRGITNGGNILESTSDGFTVDITPPDIHMESYGSESNQSRLTSTTTLYQTEVDSISSSWRVADSESPVKKMYYSVGTYPHGEDVQPRTEVDILLTGEGALPTGIKPTTDGKPNILTLTAENKLGLSASIISPYLVVDISSPTKGILTCENFIQPRSAVECTWTGFYDAESQILEFEFALGSHEGLEDIIAPVKLPGHAARYVVLGLVDKVTHNQRYYAKIKAINQLGMTSSSISNAINVDNTPPAQGTVVELKSVYIINVTDDIVTEKLNTNKCDTEEDCLAIDAVCQESLSAVNVAWQTFNDEETEIVKYEIAVGTSPGGGQLRGFFETDDVTKRYLSVTGLNLKGVRQIFVTVKATNEADLSTISTSNGIYMSYLSQGLEPLTHIGIWDGESHDGDLDFQTSLSRMGAKWDVSGDPCPVVKYEWAIQRADGLRVQEYFNTEGRTNGVNDQLAMRNMERYCQYLRVTNALNYTYTIRSNGITIEDDPLVPGQVNDGDVVGFDLQFLRTKSKVSANWDKFGSDGNADGVPTGIKAENVPEEEKEKSSSQEVAFYEVALGTDRRFPKTRGNVMPFVNVGLNKTVTFYDLDLTPVTAIYYFTVRAHSLSGSKTAVTSNGFSVGFDGGVSVGFIDMKEFVNTDTYVDVTWDGFESKIGIMMYYVGLSNNTVAKNYKCGHFTERGSVSDDERRGIFNVVDLHNMGKDTFMKFENLSLEQNGVYYAWVIGADKAGECNLTSHMFQVDVTPPVKGKIRTGPYYDMKLSYSASRESLQTYWTGFSDEDSGIRCYHAALLKRASCDEDSEEETVVESIEIDVNYTSYKFMDITLQANAAYFVRLEVENFAGLKSMLYSPPILYDNSIPSPGIVIDGPDFTNDISWSGSANTVTGTFLHHPVTDGSPCPVRQIRFDDSEWMYLESDRNHDSNNRSLTLTYRSANVHPESRKVDIKLARDTKADTMFSGTYFRDADLDTDGEYKLSIRAAAGDGQAVTSVLFWDGPDDYILEYDYTPVPDWTESICACCRVEPENASCTCNCEAYLQERKNISKRSVDQDDPGYEVKKLTDEEKKKLQETGSITGKTEIGNPNLHSRKACGVQLFAGAAAKLVSWCSYGDNLIESVTAVRDLLQDPSRDYHQYMVKFTTRRYEARGSEVTWCMSVFMDNDLMTERCGMPRLSPDTKLYLGVWNYKNYIPDTERDSEGHLKVWSATASFRDLVMPADKEQLCRYGNPLQGGNNPIVRYEAGIGSVSGLSDVVPYQQVHTPCIPCLTPCDVYTCDASCDNSSIDQVKITINDLNLTETTVVEGKVVPVLYYLTVKAVLGSGTEAVSSSDGFQIDTSPPLFDTDVMLYIDVTQGNFTPVTYQGSNDTIKAVWKCNDNQSGIMNYEWAIGTAPGGKELQTFVSTREYPGSVNSGLGGLLEHNKTYYVTVRCTNGGGLVTTYADPRGVTVLLKPPIVDDVNTTIVGAESLGETVVPPNSMKTTDKNTVGASWTVSADESIIRYDFCVGSSEFSISDIFPCTWVGYNTSGTVTVEDGYLKLNGHNIYMLSQYKAGSDASDNTTTDKSAFTMAPGTEMFIFMKMCNEAQLCTPKLMGSIIVETDKSTMATSPDGSAVTVGVGGGVRRKRDVSGVTVSTPDGLQAGQSIVVTQLTKLDLETEYKSDSSVEFVPYITDPSMSTTEDAFTDRILRKRLNYQETDLSFSLTSIGNLPMPGPVKVTFTYDPTMTDTTLMLLHWNTDAKQWQQSNKTCQHETDTEVRDPGTSLVTVKVCNTRSTQGSSSRRRRSVSDTYFRHPTQFLLTSALTQIPNSPPQLTSTTSLVMQEDQGTMIYQMTSTDAHGDVVKYKMRDDFVVGDLELTLSEDGLMTYTPALNYHGSIEVPVVLYEMPQVEIPPANTAVKITITINSVNDAPSAFVFSDGVSFLHADPAHPVQILLEQARVNDSNPTTYIWEFGAYDVDVDDNMTIYYTLPTSGNLTVSDGKTKVPCSYNTSGIPCEKLNLPPPFRLPQLGLQNLSVPT
ncbi:uncharacterized protein LOC124282192 [Haliotis rubra]|uniref:uncharacterized protein LOC124282192 n=1 Tax=Haliotis rubra TaxID=36100 RepID=UPI001EE5D7ED|nr:uncharacterized protein LOC124282192 [Haliotis rubra]